MPTINGLKKKALNNAGYSGDINTAEYKWLRAICSPYKGSIPDMWRYALKITGYNGDLIKMQTQMLRDLGYTTGANPNKWYKYWKDKPLQLVGDPVQKVFADGTDGFYHNFSTLSKLWQDASATTPVAAAGNNIARSDDSSPRGRNSTQATTAAQPKWQTAGLARFDGSDDYLATTLAPGASMTYLVKLKVGAIAGRQIIGATDGVNGRAFMGIDSVGLLAGGVGAQSVTTIKGGSDVRGQTLVAGLRFDGTTVTLFNNANSIYSAAQSGTPSTTFAVFFGAINNGAVPFSFGDHDIYRVLAIKKALTAAEITSITNYWGTT